MKEQELTIKLLQCLESKALLVSQMLKDDRAEIYKDYDGVKMDCPSDTHYVMRGGKVVHIGNVKTVTSFAYSFNQF